MTESSLLTDQLRVRDSLVSFVRADLIGPREPDEVLDEPPLTHYIAGILYPMLDDGATMQSDYEGLTDVADDDGDFSSDPAVAMSNIQYPASAGVTFAVAPDVSAIEARVSAARYVPEEAGWRRVPVGPHKQRIGIDVGERSYPIDDGLELYVRIRDELLGARSVTAVLVNTQTAKPGHKDASSFFQVELELAGVDGEHPFVARPEQLDVQDEDLESNALLYRDKPEFAVGHGCAADWERSSDGRARSVSTTFMPEWSVPIMRPNPDIDSSRLGFDNLAAASSTDRVAILEALAGGYAGWIEDRKLEALTLPENLQRTAERHLEACEEARDRIRKGIAVLRDDPTAARAFVLANRAMADQMEAAARAKDGDAQRAKFGWRPFQLAFVLLTIPSIVDPDLEERAYADLLWFPTGGGKTEAYLGLFAFTVFYRRLRFSGEPGVTAIMRYTLRLLTTQQFERASRVVCACERIRRAEPDLGDEPISIGLFVGQASTPNTVVDAEKALQKLRAGRPVPKGNPCQLRSCPWCATPLGPTHYVRKENPARIHIECRNPECDFGEGIPVYVVDEDLYRVRPSLVIGTVDKFAALPWRPQVGQLFNLGEPANRPPDLIIQDELHLISGPLGTLTGLYETAVDILCSQNGPPPKVIASTATIRRAGSQTSSLFARGMRQFPPPGLDPGDNWFATEAPESEVGPRRYVGLMAPGTSHATLLIRTYAALMHAAHLEPKGPALDPYWTLVGYFNSLRVLGAARMQIQDDVHDWLKLLAGDGPARELREPIELTSRADSGDIPKYLEHLDVGLPSEDALDVVLATNMISVGVDIDRLGLMVVMGQPQAAAEYIQATSRVGRKHPGLVVTLFNAARSRDRSHYEAFRGFHEAMYRSVEPTSVTPFSPRARDRGLHAVLVALARQLIPGLRDNSDAGKAPDYEDELIAVADQVVGRARRIEPDQADAVQEHLDEVIADWLSVARRDPNLAYEVRRHQAGTALLTPAAPETEPEDGFATMWSLRDVDTESHLYPLRGSR